MELKKNDKIIIASIASPFKKEEFIRGVDFLKKNHFIPIYNKNIFNMNDKSIFKEDLNNKVNNFEKFLKNDFKALFFARGGYGVIQLLDLFEKIDFTPLKNKIIMGFSDITIFLAFIYYKYNYKSFYGPNIVSPFLNKKIIKSLNQKTYKYKLKNLINKKDVTGKIFGGCLSVLTTIPNYLKLDNHILFIEDVNEAPYKIDRMLSQLILLKKINKIKAIVVGNMKNCSDNLYTWQDPLKRIAKLLNIPVYYGLNIGHEEFSSVLPLGEKAFIKNNQMIIERK